MVFILQRLLNFKNFHPQFHAFVLNVLWNLPSSLYFKESVLDTTKNVKNAALLDACRFSVPFAVRSINELATLLELELYSEKWFIHSTMEKNCVF